MNNFIWNLFSPRSTRQEDAAQHADDEDDSSESELANDPLSDFFNTTGTGGFFDECKCKTDDVGDASRNKMTYTQWRKGRHKFLEKYFKHRLWNGETAEECGGRKANGDESDGDGDSFCSEVLDADFETQIGSTEDKDAASQKSQDESEVLETQPQTQLPLTTPTKRPSKNFSQQSGKSTLSSINTSEAASGSGRKRRSHGGLFSGIKRKLGFLQQEEDPDDNIQSTESTSCPAKPNSQPDSSERPKKKRRRTTDSGKIQRGRMWNGDFTSIPHAGDASHSTTKLREVDLHVQNLDLRLCQVLRVWSWRETNRMDKCGFSSSYGSQGTPSSSQPIDTEQSIHCMSTLFACHEDDGPLNTIYDWVLSVEVLQLDDATQLTALSSPRVSKFAKAAFGSGQKQLQKVSERKHRHDVRRIRIFFYNGYAEAVSRVLNGMSSKSSKKTSRHYLISLENIPAQCIMPHSIAKENPHLQQYISNPFGDEEFGALSPYCICVGDASSLRFDSKKDSFDPGDLQIRLVETPVVGDNGHALDSIERKDAIVDTTSVKAMVDGKGYCCEGRPSTLIKRFWSVNGGQQQQDGMTILVGDEGISQQGGEAAIAATAAAPNPSATQEDNVGENDASLDSSNAGEETHSGEATTGNVGNNIARSPPVQELSNMLPLLRENGMRPLKDPLTVYGVVLGFSAPSLMKSGDWKMSMVLIDESLPISTAPEDEHQSGESLHRTIGRSNKNEIHVPSITVNLFVKKKTHLPVIRSAGDVVCCQNATLQQYNNEPQLLCARRSSVVVVRPTQTRNPGVELHDSFSPSDWSLSCSCHEDSSQARHPQFQWKLTNDLWRWGQKRLSSHPTMSPNCKLSISGLDQPAENVEVSVAGDLTAMITAIIPCQVQQRCDTPRGYIRIWDGTGPPRSDPLPPDVVVNANHAQGDPPEKVLVKIEDVIKSIASNETHTTFNGIEAPISLTGRVINAIIWEEELWQLIKREDVMDVGSFVRVRNTNSSKLPSGVNCLSVHSKSSLTPLPFDAYEVQLLLKEHNTRIKRGAATNPTSGILPGSCPRFVLPTLAECIQRVAPFTFTVQFQISSTIPPFNPMANNAMKNMCCKNRDGSMGLRFALHIYDNSAEIDVLCLGAVAEKLIRGNARAIFEYEDARKQSIEILNDIMTPGHCFEGEIRSVMGRDKKIYYLLKSMTCMQADV